jgi:hypothetical protein
MQHSHLPEAVVASVPLREFRDCVLRGIPVAPAVEARLEAQGIDTSELRVRLLETNRWAA